MSPGHLPDGTVVLNEGGNESLLSVEDVEDLDAPVGRTRGEAGSVKVHLRVVNHILVARVHGINHRHHRDSLYYNEFLLLKVFSLNKYTRLRGKKDENG